MKNLGRTFTGFIFDVLETMFIGAVIFGFVYVFVGQLLRVTGDSMLPNFIDGEQIIAEKVSIKLGDLKRGDIVVFDSPVNKDRLIIKRVIGMPGESVMVSQGRVYINGNLLNEPYLAPNTRTEPGKILKENEEFIIPSNSYIFMGDNRNNSTDSREWGAIDQNLIEAKGFLIYYPLSKFRFLR